MTRFSVIALLMAGVVLASCGGHHKPAAPVGELPVGGFQAPQEASDGSQLTTPRETTLDEALAELDALETPAGVDASVFAQLKEALKEVLIETVGARHAVPLREKGAAGSKSPPYSKDVKLVSKPPSGDANRVTDLTLTDNGNGTYTLGWSYRNVGDYNQDGIVNIMDITPLAVHFNESADAGNEWIDGNGDGVINIQDITPLAANFLVSCAGYRVHALSAPGSWMELTSVAFSSAIADSGRLRFEYLLNPMAHDFYRVVAYDDAGAEGFRSLVVPTTTPQPPNIVEVNPRGGISGEQVDFSATVEGTEPFSYSWSFGGGAMPNTSDLAAPTVTLGDVGTYTVSLAASNAQGSDTLAFMLTVEPAGEPPVVNSVSPQDGVAGEQVTFTADVSGMEPFTYSWDFGGGATPNTSTQPSPTVTLAEAGIMTWYSATLNVTNEWGYSYYNFSLMVYLAGGEPAEIVSVQPLSGGTGRQTTFTVTATGTEPFWFNWDFGGGAEPNEAHTGSPRVTLGDIGSYDASVTVGNGFGPSDTYEFTLTVSESGGWPTDPVHLEWLETWYITLPVLTSPNRVFQSSEYLGFANEVFTLINDERTAEGLEPVEYDIHLEAVGTAHCKHMASAGFFAHDNPQGMTPGDRLDSVSPPAYDFPGLTHGENIAAGQATPQLVMTDWMNSPMHRYNIMHPEWTHVGIGIYNRPDDPQGYKIYWATEFAQFLGDPQTHDWIEPGESPP